MANEWWTPWLGDGGFPKLLANISVMDLRGCLITANMTLTASSLCVSPGSQLASQPLLPWLPEILFTRCILVLIFKTTEISTVSPLGLSLSHKF